MAITLVAEDLHEIKPVRLVSIPAGNTNGIKRETGEDMKAVGYSRGVRRASGGKCDQDMLYLCTK